MQWYKTKQDINPCDPVCITENNYTPYATRPEKHPVIQGYRKDFPVIKVLNKGDNIYFLSKDPSNSVFINRTVGETMKFQTYIGKFEDLLPSIDVDDFGNTYVFYKKELIKIDNNGRILSNSPFPFKTASLFITKENDIYLAFSLCKDIYFNKYNSAGVIIENQKFNLANEITLISACKFKDSFLACCLVIGDKRNSFCLYKIKNGIVKELFFDSDAIYQVSAAGELFYVLLQFKNELRINAVNDNNEIIFTAKNLNTYPDNKFVFYFPSMTIVKNRIYLLYNDITSSSNFANVICYSLKLNRKWCIRIENALVSTLGNTISVYENNIWLGIENRGEAIYECNKIDGNIINFSTEYPKVIGVVVKREGDKVEVDFNHPSCFCNLIVGGEYYLNNDGCIVTASVNNTYLGTAIDQTTMLLK